jgi:tripartite-type tricarboxylate transporter receptor subunit TctC
MAENLQFTPFQDRRRNKSFRIASSSWHCCCAVLLLFLRARLLLTAKNEWPIAGKARIQFLGKGEAVVEPAKAKSQKDPTPIASSGTGSIPHLALLQLQDSTKVDFIHVPYTGMSQALTDVMGGQVAGVFADVPAVMGQVKSGRLKPMGIASKNRHPGLPDVKTFEELGIKAVDTNNWYGLFVSSKTPRQLIDQINKAIKNVLLDPATSNKLLQSGAEPKSSTPEELGAILKADADKWSTLIKVKNIKANL